MIEPPINMFQFLRDTDIKNEKELGNIIIKKTGKYESTLRYLISNHKDFNVKLHPSLKSFHEHLKKLKIYNIKISSEQIKITLLNTPTED